jgi:hypothetical protein
MSDPTAIRQRFENIYPFHQKQPSHRLQTFIAKPSAMYLVFTSILKATSMAKES